VGLPKFSFSKPFSLAILRKSYPFALLFLLMMLYTRSDSVLLERLHPNGAFQSGIYAKGFRLLDAFYMFGMIFANLLLPIFSRMFKQNKTAIPEMLVSSRNLLVGGSILIAAVCFFNPDFILGLIYKNDVSASSQSFQWLMLSFIGMCLSLIYGTLLTAKGDMRFLNQLSIIGIVVNIAFNALLIPEYGAAGSASGFLKKTGPKSVSIGALYGACTAAGASTSAAADASLGDPDANADVEGSADVEALKRELQELRSISQASQVTQL
jgi:O-antigen/teichoic acid export membrane protein